MHPSTASNVPASTGPCSRTSKPSRITTSINPVDRFGGSTTCTRANTDAGLGVTFFARPDP